MTLPEACEKTQQKSQLEAVSELHEQISPRPDCTLPPSCGEARAVNVSTDETLPWVIEASVASTAASAAASTASTANLLTAAAGAAATFTALAPQLDADALVKACAASSALSVAAAATARAAFAAKKAALATAEAASAQKDLGRCSIDDFGLTNSHSSDHDCGVSTLDAAAVGISIAVASITTAIGDRKTHVTAAMAAAEANATLVASSLPLASSSQTCGLQGEDAHMPAMAAAASAVGAATSAHVPSTQAVMLVAGISAPLALAQASGIAAAATAATTSSAAAHETDAAVVVEAAAPAAAAAASVMIAASALPNTAVAASAAAATANAACVTHMAREEADAAFAAAQLAAKRDGDNDGAAAAAVRACRESASQAAAAVDATSTAVMLAAVAATAAAASAAAADDADDCAGSKRTDGYVDATTIGIEDVYAFLRRMNPHSYKDACLASADELTQLDQAAMGILGAIKAAAARAPHGRLRLNDVPIFFSENDARNVWAHEGRLMAPQRTVALPLLPAEKREWTVLQHWRREHEESQEADDSAGNRGEVRAKGQGAFKTAAKANKEKKPFLSKSSSAASDLESMASEDPEIGVIDDERIELFSTAAALWDGSVVLADFLCHPPAVLLSQFAGLARDVSMESWEWAGKSVVELGCGAAALPSCVAALHRAATVVCTDGNPHILPRTQSNVEAWACAHASATRVQVAQMRWGDSAHLERLRALVPTPVDVVLAADVLYVHQNPGAWGKLLKTLHSLTGPSTLTFVTYTNRGNHKLFLKFRLRIEEHFHVTIAPQHLLHPFATPGASGRLEQHTQHVDILCLTRKATLSNG